jgi:DNA gyrase subunit B
MVADRLRQAKLEVTVEHEEEHSAWMAAYRDPTNAIRVINTEFLALPEFRRLRALVKQVARFNTPPFTVVKDNQRDVLQNWRDLLNTVKNEGTREVNIQRYKGLGEMNAEQLWATTMNAETRTLLQVDLKDFAETEPIFSTLMGEDVESRRKFIEENALDVRNLDV